MNKVLLESEIGNKTHHHQAFSTLKRDASISVGYLQQHLLPGVVQEISGKCLHPGGHPGLMEFWPPRQESGHYRRRIVTHGGQGLSPWMDVSIKLLSRSRVKPVGWREKEAPIYNCNESSKLSHTWFFSRAHSTSEDGYWTFLTPAEVWAEIQSNRDQQTMNCRPNPARSQI